MLVISPGDPGIRLLRWFGNGFVLFYWILFHLTFTPLLAQKPSEQELFENGDGIVRLENDFRNKYGPDQRLINGKRYYNQHLWSTGHKFLGEDKYQPGELMIDKHKFNNLQLKYDIYNQQVLLLHGKEGVGYNEIIINSLKLNEFQLGDKVFEKCYFPETDTLLLQVYKGKQITFLYHWWKELIPKIRGQYNVSEFSLPKRKCFVLLPSGVYEFSNARSFAKIFPEHRSELLKFMRDKDIRLKKASYNQILELHQFCNQILDQSFASQ